MSNSTKPIRPAIKWHGGKFYLAKSIVEKFPAHNTYVEPFGGAASVLINKPASAVEVYNDLYEELTRFFRVLRDNGSELQRRLQLSPYSEADFLADQPGTDDEIELARRFFARFRQSIGGRGAAFSYSLHRSRRGLADVVSGYLSAIDEELPKIVERLRGVQILCRDAIEVIQKWDSGDTLFYCDPPYPHRTRESTSVYACEMSDEDHRRLAGVLNSCKGRVILSGYPSDLYDELYQGWSQVSFDIANHAAGGESKSRKTEVLWMNFEPVAQQAA